MEINPILNSLKDIGERTELLRTYLEYDVKKERLEEVQRELEDPEVWNKTTKSKNKKINHSLSTLVIVGRTVLILIIHHCHE